MKGDGLGRVFVLIEPEGKIRVLNAEGKLIHTITLKIKGKLKDDWDVEGDHQSDENSLAEGFLPMKNGHILVLKEKEPALFVEFGPYGEDALGVYPETILQPTDNFQFDPSRSESTLVNRKTWKLKSVSKDLVGDLSDLAVAPDGNIYALSDKSRLIVKLERDLRLDENKVEFDAAWKLPKKIEEPEGLVMTDAFGAIVAQDIKGDDEDDDEDNVFLLAPLVE